MKKGDKVHWNWGASKAEGVVEKVEPKTVDKAIKGTKVKRKGTKDNPAVEVKQANGDKVLKSAHELKKGGK